MLTLEQSGAIIQRKTFKPGELGPFIFGYRTKGGGYIIANDGKQNDSGKPRDMVYVWPGGGVVALTPMVNPDFVAEIEKLVAA